MSFTFFAPLRHLRLSRRACDTACDTGRDARPAVTALVVATLLFGGCREEEAPRVAERAGASAPSSPFLEPETARSQGGLDAADGTAGAEAAAAQTAADGVEATDAERPAVTPARIDAFLAYQRRRLELEKALWADLAAEEVPAARRGSSSRRRREAAAAAPTADALRRLEERAEEDAEALEAAGLSPAELVALDALIREVLSPRQLVRELALEETVTLLEEQAERLEGTQREELLAQVGPLKERMTTLRALADVRRTHGDAAVDAVLAREDALLAWQEARLTTLLEDAAGEGEGQAGGRQ